MVNATGPKLNFDATRGLGPGKNSLSVCTASHAAETSRVFLEMVERMKRGEKKRFVIGVGHGGCTCEGAAFEYVVNLEFELRAHQVRDKADIVFVTNEYELGDFGVNGVHIQRSGRPRIGRGTIRARFTPIFSPPESPSRRRIPFRSHIATPKA